MASGIPRKKARLEGPNVDERSCESDQDMFDDDGDKKEVSTDEQEDFDILASQPVHDPWKGWTSHQVADQLRKNGISEDAVQKFIESKIDGSVLECLTEEHIAEKLNIKEVGTQLKILKFLKNLGPEDFDTLHPPGTKVFNDPVHGHMEFHPLCVAIIDTAQFQRLRHLKQLGACYFVYPGASHNRFEHCLGVCHLAGLLAKALQTRQPRLGITKEDILCVQIAGLCHDLGHGPFSHVFDNKFIPNVRPGIKWEHEDASVAMFDYMVEKNQLEPLFEEYGLTVKHRLFIQEQIDGKPRGENGSRQYGQGKPFLYEIVANKRNGVDVDKWDYFRRDCYHLGMTSSFDHMRFIQFSRVIRVDNELQICVRDKEAFNMYQMFHTRHALHRKAYQHKVVQAMEIMLVEAMKEANEVIKIPGDDGKWYRISDCISSMGAYTNLTDSIFHLILLSDKDDERLKRAQKILHDIQNRHIYKCIGESVPITDTETISKKTDVIKREILEMLTSQETAAAELNLEARFVVQGVNLDFGGKDKNPVNEIRFFSKDNLNKAVPVSASEVSSMLPHDLFKEQLVRIYLCPTGDEEKDHRSQQLLQKGFKDWCKTNNLKEPKETPIKTPGKSRERGEVTPTHPTRLAKDRSAMKAKHQLSFAESSI